MADFGVTVLVGFVDYIRKLAEVARDAGLLEQINVRMICGHLGTEDRASTEAAWGGAKAFDWYGVGDTGSIAGEGPERAALTALAQECGVGARVHLLGWRQDTGALLAGCDLFICPSRHEPLGNVVLEAWSAARPVIAAASQGPRELIREGVTGLLVPVDAVEPLATTIRALLADPPRAAALAAAGRAQFALHFAEAPVLATWREFLHKVQR